MPPKKTTTRVIVLYNQVGEDEYEKLKEVDPSTLGIKAEYPITVSSEKEEYAGLVHALRKEGFDARAVNVEEDLGKLERLLRKDPPDVVFNLIEFFHDNPRMEGSVAGVFELHRIPYTGAGPFALGLCLWSIKSLH